LRSDLRIIGTLGPSTIQPLAAARHLPATLKSELRHLLAEMADDPEAKDFLSQYFIQRFVPIADRDYDDIRLMSRMAESACLNE
jgi:phosphonate transport system substrate-binding protein